MNSDHLLSYLVRREPGVRVERTDPDFDHLAWFTLRKLLSNHNVIGNDGQAVTWFRGLMKRMPDSLNAYVSPWLVVTTDTPDRGFLTAGPIGAAESKQQERLTLVGLTFGKLTLIADLPRQRHRCEQTCDNVTEVDRNHLRLGWKKSCGCLAEAQRKIFAARRHRRGR